jgi:hypothetical protein
MIIKGRRLVVVMGLLGALLGSAGPALAQHAGGGGGGHGGGGAAHAGGGHAAGGGGHFGGSAGGHYAGGAHAAAGGRYAGRGYAAGGGVAHSYGGGGLRGSAYGGRGGYAYPGGGYRHGYSTGAYWGGGYWRGGYWPRAYYGYGYSWFLPMLPLAYATYWYGGVPYYYANDVYYTWNPAYDGYTASDPPPVTETGADTSGISAPATDMQAPPPAPGGAGDPAQAGRGSQVFMYPKNGQSDRQQSTDKLECQKWASDQVGLGTNGPDYRRAFVACAEGRGYSAN